MRLRAQLATALLLAAAACGAIVLDRVAATVGSHVITESEVIEDIHVAAFLNGTKPDLSPEARRAAAERLVDQELLREQMALTGFPAQPNGEVDKLLEGVRRRFPSEAAFKTAVAGYGITPEQLKAHLAWQVAILRFTDYLFRPNIPGAPGGAGTAPAPNLDQELDSWLKQARSQTQIRFFKEAFE